MISILIRVVAVQTPLEEIACEVVVNASGLWTHAVGKLAGLEKPVQPQRRSVNVTGKFSGLPATAPMTIDVGTGFQFRPEMDDFILAAGPNPNDPPGTSLVTIDSLS